MHSSLPRPAFQTRLGGFLLILIACIYLLPGITGHGPWKGDEMYSFGMIHHMLVTGEYLVPTNAGLPFVEKPPLYYWSAVLFAKAFHPWLNYADGARVTSVFYMLVAFYFAALTAKAVWRAPDFFHPYVLGTLALFAGTAGVIRHSHDLFTDVALLCGGVIALYGLLHIALNEQAREQARAPRWSAAVWFGLGVGITQMSKGLFIPIIYAATAFWVGLIVRECRSWSYLRMVGLAVLVSLPFFLIWPALLAQHSVPLFIEWFWDNNVGRFFGFSISKLGAANDSTVVPIGLFSFALPAAPLALLALLGGDWRHIGQPRIAVPLVFSVIFIAILQTSASARQVYLLPLMFPLSLLGAGAIGRLPLRFHRAWDWFSRLLFGMATVLLWVIYAISISPPAYHHYLGYLGKWLPLAYVTPLQPWALGAAIIISLIWLLSLPRIGQCGKWRGVASWFAGITMMWGVAFTLLLPWLDYAKSYESMFKDLWSTLAPAWREGDCMASIRLDESEAPMLFYYLHILHQPIARTTDCRWVIVQEPYGSGTPEGKWIPFWKGARDGDGRTTFTVYRRGNTASSPLPRPAPLP